MMKEKIILAYSGGLDTSVILKWLVNKGFEVICFIGDVGQREDFKLAESKAKSLGASKIYIEDLKKEFVENYIPARRIHSNNKNYAHQYIKNKTVSY